MKAFIFLLFLSMLIPSFGQSAVWQHNPNLEWNQEWQDRYSQWIATEVTGKFFKDLGRPYSQLKMDCADAHYALMAYFARENQLPFIVNLGKTSNLTSRFDDIADPEKRMAKFMDYLSSNYGTESLVHRDTFPPAVDELVPGDLFMWKIGKPGAYTRHTYIIKKVNTNGTFDVLYSTQANAKIRGPLKKKKNYMFTKAPKNRGNDKNRWGFRRMKWPQHASVSHENIFNADFSQYEWARKMSSLDFFVRIQELNQVGTEDPTEVIGRLFTSLCSTVKERVDIVEKALDQQKRLGGACMNFADFDAHSTPGRDSGIMADYKRLKHYLNRFKEKGTLSQIKKSVREPALNIFNSKISNESRKSLYNACPIKFGPKNDHWIDLGSFQEALFSNEVSYHPNDNRLRRWGFMVGNKTRCEEFYGYPEE